MFYIRPSLLSSDLLSCQSVLPQTPLLYQDTTLAMVSYSLGYRECLCNQFDDINVFHLLTVGPLLMAGGMYTDRERKIKKQIQVKFLKIVMVFYIW